MAIATSLEIDNVAKLIVSGKAPIRSVSTIEWGGDYPLGVLSQNVTITLPTITYESDRYVGDITITAFQPSNGSYTITIQVGDTSFETITDGSTDTTSIVYTPTAGNNITINVKPIAVNQISALSTEREGSALQ